MWPGSWSDFTVALLERKGYLVFGGIALYSAAVFFYYRRTLPPLNVKILRLLGGVRWLAVAAVFAGLSEPLVSYEKVSRLPPTVAVLVDASRSMAFREGEKTRREQALELAGQPWIDELKRKVVVVSYDFADSLLPFPPAAMGRGSAAQAASGASTNIGRALRSLGQKYREQNLSGVILLSDGANNAGPDPVGAAWQSGFPIYPCAVGADVVPADVSVDQVRAPEVAYAKEKVPVTISVSSAGFEGKRIPVEIRFDKKVVTRTLLTLAGQGKKQEVSLELAADSAGLFTYRVSVPLQAGERLRVNNERQFVLKVLPNKIRVGILAAFPSWEYRFLVQALEQSGGFEVASYFTNAPPVNASGFRWSEPALAQADLLLLLDPPGNFLGGKEARLRKFVEQEGKGLVLFFGPQLVSSWRAVDQATFPFVSGLIAEQSGTFGLELTVDGKRNGLTRLVANDEENEKLWTTLPPLLQVVAVQKSWLGGVPLVTATDQRSGQTIPVVTVGPWGQGKVFLVTGSPLWRWSFFAADLNRYPESYALFWKNCLQWLSTKDDLNRVRVSTDRLVYKAGEEVLITGSVFDERYQPLAGAQVKLQAKNLDSNATTATAELFEEESGQYQTALRALAPGRYQLILAAAKEGKQVGEAAARFTVEQFGLEDENLSVDRGLLEELARASGGKFYTPATLAQIVNDLQPQAESMAQKREVEVWNSPLLFLAIVLLLGTEWALRKRYQLL